MEQLELIRHDSLVFGSGDGQVDETDQTGGGVSIFFLFPLITEYSYDEAYAVRH